MSRTLKFFPDMVRTSTSSSMMNGAVLPYQASISWKLTRTKLVEHHYRTRPSSSAVSFGYSRHTKVTRALTACSYLYTLYCQVQRTGAIRYGTDEPLIVDKFTEVIVTNWDQRICERP